MLTTAVPQDVDLRKMSSLHDITFLMKYWREYIRLVLVPFFQALQEIVVFVFRSSINTKTEGYSFSVEAGGSLRPRICISE